MSDPTPGADSAASPTAPDFSAYESAANAADVARVSPPRGAKDADSPSAEPDAQAAGTPAEAAASEAAPPSDPPKKNAKTRGPELDAEIADLREKLRIRAALREELAQAPRPAADAKPAESSTAKPTVAEWQRYRQHPDAPKVEDFGEYEDFVAAQAVFVADRRFEERQARERADAESRGRLSETQQHITGFHNRLKAAREKDPAFDSKIDPGLLEVVPAFALRPGEALGPANVLLQECVKSEAAPDLLAYFSTQEGQAAWQRVCSAPTPAEMLKRFGRIEARFLSDGAPAAPAAAIPVSSAPPPPTTLGTRPPSAPDRAGAAVKAGDFSAYEAAQNAADLARLRGR
jgi:hypothetical protein